MPRKLKKQQRDYYLQKFNAAKRGIPFLLTFEEWWELWKTSCRYKERGRASSQYCMARLGDRGPYATGNVRIITNRENSEERLWTAETRAKLSASNRGRPYSNETRRKLREAHLGNKYCLGKTHTQETKAKISAARKGKPTRTGAVLSKETRAKISASLRARSRRTPQ